MEIVLSIPHASTVIPVWNGWEDCDKRELDEAVFSLADISTDRLFTPNPKTSDMRKYVFDCSRFYCDVERLVDDPMEEKGQGIIYTEYNGLKREVDKRLEEVIYAIRADYLLKVSQGLVYFNNPLLIDCHSFTPTEETKDIGICIGFNEDWSKPDDELLELIREHFEEHFESRGLKVAFNKPYSNSLTPIATKTYKSVMIEVNKAIYLLSDMRTERADMYKVNGIINELYKKILDYGK